MKLVNIYNSKRTVYLFCRDEKGNQIIKEDTGFFPYFYMIHPEGEYRSFLGESLKKVFVSTPSEVPKHRTNNSYEADILFCKRYMIDKVDKIEKCPIKYGFIDIEVEADEMPNPKEAKYPISCISIYNSMTKDVKTFSAFDYKTEYEMLETFCTYIKKEAFDLLLAWNMDGFDYPYLYNRIPDFAQKISPIGRTRYGDGEVYYPAGVSIIDYLKWYKKITLNRKQSYALDNVAIDELKIEQRVKVEFGKLTEEILRKNIEDVQLMAQIEDKKQLIPYFDEVRRLAKVEWEDLIWNSRTIDMLLLQEAKNKKIVLPMKPSEQRGTLEEKEEFEGAYRKSFQNGAHWGCCKLDLTSAYPNAIIDFCLDPANIIEVPQAAVPVDPYVTIDNTTFKQDPDALLPTVVKKLMTLKDTIKQELKQYKPDTQEYKDKKIYYDAIKTIVNSSFGVMGNRFFRMYNNKVASAITFVVRSLLKYVKDGIEKQGYKVLYVDTDSIIASTTENLKDKLNALIQEWAKVTFNKENVNIQFEYEGYYEKLLILTKCRYIGYLRTDKGIEEEIKGVESKRKDSTTFMKKFQRTLIDKILNKEAKENIFAWIKEEIKNFQNQPLQNIAFPCRLARPIEDYKNLPIFARAVQETEGFNPRIGENFYYVYVKPEFYYDEKPVIEYYQEVPGKREGTTKKKKLTKKALEKLRIKSKDVSCSIDYLLEEGTIKKQERIQKTKKARDVKAFNEDTAHTINDIDWKKMLDRNIYMKLTTIFEAMGWEIKEVL